MSKAAVMVKLLLGETGEADQDYDHEVFDSIVNQLAAAGYPGGRHREFDKYQGVYLVIPGVDKFWASYEGGMPALIPENDPQKMQDDEVTEIPIDSDEDGGVDITYLLDYINNRYAAKFAQMKAQADAENFIDRTFGKKPRRGSTRREG